MDPLIVSFLAVGLLFGLLTYSNRHCFSEGTTTRSQGARDAGDSRAMWVAMCVFLWPIFIVTGLFSAWARAQRRARAASGAAQALRR
jgi:hypothetical protein